MRAAAFVTLVLLAPAIAAAQGVTSPYLELVWRYRAGDTRAVRDVVALPISGLRARVLRDLGPYVCEKVGRDPDCDALRARLPAFYREHVARLLARAIPAAIVVHLHASSTFSVAGQREPAMAHRELVKVLLDRLASIETVLEPPDAARLHELRRRAHLLVIWMYQSEAAVEAVDPYLRGVVRAFPNDPDLLLASGWVEETRARMPFLLRAQGADTARRAGALWLDRERAFRLQRAVERYRGSLAAHPRAETRVHLARVLFFQNRLDDARATLDEVGEDAEPQLRYLAALFRAAIEERAQRLPAARRAYEAALRAWPAGQAARVGLARLLGRDGDRAGAAALITELPLSPPQLDAAADPWAWYPLGQSWRLEAAFLALRADLHR
jgi:hypothetical protein